jgi:hypothetical protein
VQRFGRSTGRPVTRREAWLTVAGLFALALVVRAVVASTIPFPTPEDTAYYYGVARNLVEGRGLVSDAIWSYQTPPLVFPRPAFEVWLPLPAFLAAIPMVVLGTGFHAAQVSTVILGSLVPVLAWWVAADVAEERGLPVGRARTLAVGAGLTAVVLLPLLLFGVLPDSTTPFTVIALAACLLMTRLAADASAVRPADPRLLGLGILFGLAALTRNEFVWLGLAWVVLAWRARPDISMRGQRIKLIAIPAVIGAVILAPWLARDWAAFGNPLPGQAAANALSVTGFDIFAYEQPPTLARYLAQGPLWLASIRLDGLSHNLFTVLLIPSFPVGLLGLVSLPWVGRDRALRPLLIVGLLTFTATTLLFPVSTTWGTFLHAAGPVHVLLIVSCLVGLDLFIAWVGRWRGWTRPVAWLAPTLTLAVAVLFSLAIAGYGNQAGTVERRYDVLGRELAVAGLPPDRIGPVIADFPIWYAVGVREEALALPDEPPSSVVDLARRFGATVLVVSKTDHGRWPAVIDQGGPDASCFTEVRLAAPANAADADALGDTRVFRIGCP